MVTKRKYQILRKHKLSTDTHTAEAIYATHQLGSSAYVSYPCTVQSQHTAARSYESIQTNTSAQVNLQKQQRGTLSRYTTFITINPYPANVENRVSS